MATDLLCGETADCASDWLDMVESEHGYLMALAMLEADKKRAEREAEWVAQAADIDAQVNIFKQEEE